MLIAGTMLTFAIVSQFTLLARTKKGTKPDFHGAMNPEEAAKLYHQFVQKVRDDYAADKVKDGKFQAMMEVALVNDGPVSFPVAAVCATRLPQYSRRTKQ
jgi:D-tyrosyl-tRNA(Tyr) deacylase